MRNVNVHFTVPGGICIAAFCTEKAAKAYALELGERFIKIEIKGYVLLRK